ncbi:MAG: sensor of ECF-type sigma factor [Draconibacterium sp.]|nr:sensor of ECF-type sigma factor [Draconibacterium sp.]
MKREIGIILTFFIVLMSFAVYAQDKDSHEARMEKYRAEKVSFLTTKLDLTPAEAEKFWPIYNQMDRERWEAQKCRRDLENKVSEAEESLSDNEIIKLTREFSGSMQKEGTLMTSYNEKLLKVLPPKKVLKLYKAENEFRMSMIRKYRDNKDDKGEK